MIPFLQKIFVGFFFCCCYRQTSTLTILVATNLLEVLMLVLLLWANHNLIFLFFFSFCNLIYFLSVKAFVVLFHCTYCVGRIPQETMLFVISTLRKGTQMIHPTTCTKSHRPSMHKVTQTFDANTHSPCWAPRYWGKNIQLKAKY